jgi:hypothetical protein
MLPSLPFTVTAVALVAVTVNVEEAPAAMLAGTALIVTVGFSTTGVATVTVAAAVAGVVPETPVAVAV